MTTATYDLEAKLKQYFGYNTFRANQKEIVSAILENKDVLAILPTGAGKSLCYQLPAMILEGTAIVISPLISLMQDQVESLSKNGLSAVYLNSSLSSHDQWDLLKSLSQYKILFIAPERLSDPQFVARLKETPLSFFVFDEAHCISQWGHAFRPEYRQVGFLKTTFNKPVLAFTATATVDVEKDILEQLSIQNALVIKASFDRPNLTIRILQRVVQTTQLLDFIAKRKNKSGIVYAATRKTVDQTHKDLLEAGYIAGKYHAGLTNEERAAAQRAFILDQTPLMVATVAFGMGIHKPDVRFIFHMDMPRTIEQYYQEIGRAGRDGLPSECCMLYSTKELVLYKHFSEEYTELLLRKNMHRKTEQMYSLCNSYKCRRKELLSYFNEQASWMGCQGCDNCLDDVEMVEGTVIAQKILSCVHRLGMRFGINYVMDVLRGSKAQNIFNRGHDKLSTYRLMEEYSESDLRYYIEGLINQNYLKLSEGEYPVLQWTEESKDVIQGKAAIKFRKKHTRERKKAPIKLDHDEILFEKLRLLRKELAQKEQIPPYVVFSDKTLLEMAAYFPQSQEEFVLINGVGPIKCIKYGNLFLELIQSYCEEHAIFKRHRMT
jgi:ATP-dependent DNA helicase RecQ